MLKINPYWGEFNMLKIMFYISDGVGLGHTSRTLNIAKALRKLINCKILFVTQNKFKELLEKEGFEYIFKDEKEKELKNLEKLKKGGITREEYCNIRDLFVLEQIKKFRPDMLFFDQTILPGIIEYAKSKNIFLTYILREMKSQNYFLDLGKNRANLLSLFDLVLIPHEKEEVNNEFKKLLNLGFKKEKIFFVGNIFRALNLSKIPEIEKKYKQNKAEILITVVGGGGGIIQDTKKFFNHVANLAKKINLTHKNIKWLFVKGPLFTDSLSFKEFDIIDYELNMPELFAVSDLIISRGGYNSVNEIITAKTPALINPGFCFYDDQKTRIQRYVNKGFIKLFNPSKETESLHTLNQILQKNKLKEIKSKYNHYTHKNNNILAASLALKEYFENSVKKNNIAFLRYRIDTVGENFIYEETENLKKYKPFYFCGKIIKTDKTLQTVCFPSFEKISFKWPKFQKKYLQIYRKGMNLFYDFIKSADIKILHAQFATDALFYHGLIKKTNYPLVISVRGYDLFTHDMRSSLPLLFPITSKFIVKSKNMKKELIELGCDPSKIEIIYGGINLDKIPFKFRKIKQDRLKIISAGRFVEKKGFDITLKSFKKILQTFPNARLTIIGEGELKTNLEHIVKKLKLTEKVNIKPYLPHNKFIKELYAHDIFLLLSKTAKNNDKEGIPNVLKEAMASGMPVISTKHSGIPELIKDNDTGYLISENDSETAIDKIKKITNDLNKTFEICLKARFWVEKKFNKLNTIQKTEAIYDDLLLPDYIKNILVAKENKNPIEFRADLHLISGCNSRCIMCDNWKNKIKTKFSTKDALKLLDNLKNFGVNHIRFHGQEPTLRKDLPMLIKESKKRGFRVGLKSNALNLNEKNITEIAKFIDDIYLSIDSYFEEIHNNLRGNDISFNQNIITAKLFKKINPSIKLYFNSIITNVNYKTLDKLLDLGKKLNADKISFVNLNSKNKNEINDLVLTEQQLKEFYFDIFPNILTKSMKYNLQVSVDPYFYALLGLPRTKQISMLENNPEQFEEEIQNYSKGNYGKFFYEKCKCYGVLDHITIDWEGNVYPCCAMPRLPGLEIGNIYQTELSELWKNKKYIQYRKDILKGKCKFKNECTRNLVQTKEINKTILNLEQSNNPDSNKFILESYLNQYTYNNARMKRKLMQMFYFSLLNYEFYMNKFTGKISEHTTLNQLPITSRDELKIAFFNMVNNYFEQPYGVFRTSSTGKDTFLFAKPLKYVDFPRMAVAFINTNKWEIGNPWVKITSPNCINTGCIPQKTPDKIKNLTIMGTNFLAESKEQILKKYNLIKNSKSRLIHSNPTYLKLLLFMFNKYSLKLEENYAINSTYEILLPTTKKLIKKYLKCDIYNQYGCSELGPVSFSCKHNKNHIFTEAVYVEVIPDKLFGRKDIGRVVVTDLRNTVMPFVRYYSGDMAYIIDNEKCNCELATPIMGEIVGREKELIYNNGKAIPPLEIDSIFNKINNILMYQLISEKEKFTLELVLEEKSKKCDLNGIKENFKKIFGNSELEIKIKDIIFPDQGKEICQGKYKTVAIK